MKSAGLTGKTIGGVVFLVIQTVCVRLSGLAGQVVLSWLLLPEDFGLIGLCYTVLAFANITREVGIREFLIRRKQVSRWLQPAMGLALVTGLASGAFILAAAPLAGLFYKEPRVVPLLQILALAQPFSTMSAVLMAMLQRDMRFRALAVLGSAGALGRAMLSVALAYEGFGAYAFVIPLPCVEFVLLLAYWWCSRQRIGWRLETGKWRYFLKPTAIVFLVAICHNLNGQSDYILLGFFADTQTVGLYFFACSFAVQAVSFLWSSLGAVLLPAYSSVRSDPVRLGRAFKKTVRMVALFFVPVSLLQVPLAAPVVHLFFAEKWTPAIPLIQIISFSLAINSVAEPCQTLMLAQGRLLESFLLNLIWTLGLILVIGPAASTGDPVRVASAVAIYYVSLSPAFFWAASRTLHIRGRDLLQFYVAPVLTGGIAIGCGWLAAEAYALTPLERLCAVPLLSAGVYALLLRVAARDHFHTALSPLIRRTA